jgi:tetratricopeptide (TPR) repeat protein
MSSGYSVLLVLTLTAHAPAPAGEGSWVGKRVILKEPGVRMGPWREAAGEKSGTELRRTVLVVIEDKVGFLSVRQDGKIGWFPKNKAILAADGVAYFGELIKKDPAKADSYKRRAAAWSEKKDSDKALQNLNEAIRLDPKEHSYWIERGIVFLAKNKPDKAVKDFNEAIKLKPTERAHAGRGTFYLDSGDFDKAVAEFDEAIRLNPDYAPAYGNRGYGHVAKADYRQALFDYDTASRLDPDDPLVYNNKADLLACCPDPVFRDGAKAVEIATKACDLTKWKNGTVIDTLAAAYAESGQFDEAVKWINKALEDDSYRKEHGDVSRFRLRFYEAGKPYHYGDGE